jgi:hypothetical protein
MPSEPTNEDSPAGTRLLSLPRKITTAFRGSLFVALFIFVALGACDSTEPSNAVLKVPGAEDTTTPPGTGPDTVTGDSAAPPQGTDTIVPPPDTIVPPPDTTQPPPGPVSHVGIPFGPAHVPAERFGEFGATLYTAGDPSRFMRDLEAARRAGARLLIGFTGNSQYNRDGNGFSLTKWKARVDRFRGFDLTPYITDGTIVGHWLMDEPHDPSDWSGKPVSQADIEEIARYSKEVWPSMPTVIRTFPSYLAGYQYPHLDAVQVQYLDRFGDIEQVLATHVEGAKALGLALVGGLNVLNGGSGSSGIPGHRAGKWAMSADEIRSWGKRFLSEPSVCAFLMWEYDPTYLSRPDIQAALSELSQIAADRPEKACRP